MPAPLRGVGTLFVWHLCKSLTINGVWGPPRKWLKFKGLRMQKIIKKTLDLFTRTDIFFVWLITNRT